MMTRFRRLELRYMHSLTTEYLAALRFDGTQAATLRALGEYQGKQQLYAAQSPEILKGLRQTAVVESTESSNRLEGVVVAPSRLKSLVIRNATPKSRSEQEIAGYRDALALIHESAAHMPFSEGVVLQLHTLLYRYMPQAGGRWKATNNDIIERHPDGTSRLRFQPVAAHLTPMAMTDLTRHYATALDKGFDVVAISGQVNGGSQILVGNDLPIKENDWASLKKVIADHKAAGKPFRVAASRGNAQDIHMRGAFAKQGIDVNKDVQFVNIPNPSDHVQALRRGILCIYST